MSTLDPPPPRFVRRRRVLVAGALVLALVAVVVVRALAGPDREASRPGEAWEVAASEVDTDEVGVVELPVGELRMSVGTPTRAEPAALATGSGTADAGDGARYVAVAWALDVRTDVLGTYATRYQFRVALVVGDDRYDLQAGDAPLARDDDPAGAVYGRVVADTAGRISRQGAKALVVLVASADDDLDDASLEVEYDGLVQRLDVATGDVDAGGAAVYYTEVATPQEECDVFTRDQPRRLDVGEPGFVCELTDVAVTPYLPERGWVESAGQAWVRASLWVRDYRVVQATRTGRLYYAARDEVSLRLDGEKALDVHPDERADEKRVHTFLADTLPAELTLAARYRATDRDGQDGGIPFGGSQVFTLG